MLQHLHIRNYALISQLDIDFGPGLSVITGETGAGKSIILGALALVMGARADTKTITEGEERCIIEADFGDVLIRRELSVSGRSRSFVNDEVVTQAELKALANRLIDIHSQHENLLLADDSFQLSVVDALAHNEAERTAYAAAYTAWQQAQQALSELQALAERTRNDADYVAYQYHQLEEANLVSGEQEELEQEEYRLTHAEQFKTELQNTLQALENDEDSAIERIRRCDLSEIDGELHERLSSLDIELRDIVREINRLYDRWEFDPERLQQVQERLDTLNTLLRKHSVRSIDELITLREQLGERLHRIDSFDEDITRLTAEVEQRHAELTQAAQMLTKTRMTVREPIAQQLRQDLSGLGVAHANVDIDITPLSDFAESGADNIRFMFAANLNQSLRPVSEVASGGEISRLMLCIKALIASSNGLPTIIFDEIDTGVSGSIASRMGQIMQQMAQSRQIIAITHLPQIAASGQAHYRVYKADSAQRTETHIEPLDAEQRVQEIAGMLAGDNITPAALDAARTLLNDKQ